MITLLYGNFMFYWLDVLIIFKRPQMLYGIIYKLYSLKLLEILQDVLSPMKLYVKLNNIEVIFIELSGNYGMSSWFPFMDKQKKGHQMTNWADAPPAVD